MTTAAPVEGDKDPSKNSQETNNSTGRLYWSFKHFLKSCILKVLYCIVIQVDFGLFQTIITIG
jgi:hypothetical protein